MGQSLYVTNLVGTTFFKCSDNVVKAPDSTALKDLIDHLSFMRVSCTVNGKLVNSRIKQSPFHTQFCLKLPQSSYDKATDKATSINTPVRIIGITLKPPGITAGTNLLSAFTATISPSQVINTPTPALTTSIAIVSTPKIDILLNIDHSTAGEIISYFCDMIFLDDQEAFFKNFRDNPDMLLYNANKQGEGGTKKNT